MTNGSQAEHFNIDSPDVAGVRDMLTSRRGLLLLCVAIVTAVSIMLVLAKNVLEMPSSEGQTPLSPASFEKTGEIERITYYYAPALARALPPLTCIEFADNDELVLWGTLTNITEGKTYRIVYREYDTRTDGRYWSAIYFVADEIEEIIP